MSWLHVRAALLSSVVLASSAAFVRADCGCAAPAAAPCAAPCAPATRTVTVTEWVPEKYEATRTVYKQECVQENYTACRTECTMEQRTRDVTVYKSVAETHNETRCVTRCVPCVEDRCVTKQVVTCVPETTYTHKCVDKGHYECREVACGPTLGESLHSLFHKNECCECACECACPRTKTVQVWVACKVDECVPCTHNVRHVECVQTVEHVTVYKHVSEQVTVPVTCFHCVPECVKQTYTVSVPHQVSYQAVRNVTRCVPVTETYTACKMVAHCVEKQVACEAPACGACSTCGSCSECGFHLGGRLQGLFHKDCGCESSCGSCGCSTGCGCH
jgi:hypothetical protein